jgi:phage minor structural protein
LILVLNKDEVVKSVLTNNGSPDSCPYYNDSLKEYIATGASTYEFYVPSNHDAVSEIVESGYVVIKDLDGVLRMFQIISISDTHAQGTSGAGGAGSNKYVYCEDAGLELLDDVIRPVTYSNVSAQTAITNLLVGQRWQVGQVDDVFALQTLAYSNYETLLNGLQTASTTFGGELQFRVVITNGKVTGRFVDLLKQRGKVTNKRFTYSKDMLSVQRQVDLSNICTALIGVGNNDLTFSTLSYTKATNGFDKPSGQDWVGDDDALQQYGHQGKHIFKSFTFDTDDKATLLQKTYAQLQIQKNPSVTYTMQVTLLERLAGIEHESVRIGDTVYVIDQTFSPALLLSARILELDTCFSDPMQDVCTLGNYVVVQSNITAQMRALQMTLLQKSSNWDDAYVTANQALNQAQIVVSINSTNGVTFKNGVINTSLVVTVMQGESDVTATMPASAFVWHKFNSDGTEDMTWYTAHLGIGRSVAVTYADSNEKATFECDVDTSTLTA